MNFASTKEARDADFTKLNMTNENLPTQLRQKEDHIRALQAKWCNLKLAAATQTTDVKGSNKTVHPYSHEKKQKPQWPTHPTEKNIATDITVGIMDKIQADHTRHTHTQGQCLVTIRRLRNTIQRGVHITTRHTYGKKDERNTEEIIK